MFPKEANNAPKRLNKIPIKPSFEMSKDIMEGQKIIRIPKIPLKVPKNTDDVRRVLKKREPLMILKTRIIEKPMALSPLEMWHVASYAAK